MTGKSLGEDPIPNELLKLALQQMAMITGPLAVKTALRIQEPLIWKGGIIAQIYKGAGDPKECDNSRDILSSSNLGKRIHSAMRSRLRFTQQQTIRDTQAGVSGRGTDITALGVRLFIQYAIVSNKSAVMIFLDIIGAFHAVVRQIAMDLDCTDLDIARLTSTCNLLAYSMHRLAEIISQPSILSRNNVDDHLHKLVAEMHTVTWSSTPGVAEISHNLRGSRAGDQFGDIIFTFIMTQVMNHIESRLDLAGLTHKLPYYGQHITTSEQPPQTVNVVDQTYVDDNAIPALLDDPTQVFTKPIAIVRIALEVCLEHNFRLNCKPHKSTAMAALRGRGSRQAKIDLYIHHESKLQIHDDTYLHFTGTFKHVGGLVTPDDNIMPEIKNRQTSTFIASKPLTKQIINNPGIPLNVKAHTTKSLCFSRTFYNACTWSNMSEAAKKYPTRNYHAFASSQHKHRRTYITRPAFFRRPRTFNKMEQAPLDTIRCSRLHLLPRLLQHGGRSTLALVQALASRQSTWTNLLLSDLKWLYTSLGRNTPCQIHNPIFRSGLRLQSNRTTDGKTLLNSQLIQHLITITELPKQPLGCDNFDNVLSRQAFGSKGFGGPSTLLKLVSGSATCALLSSAHALPWLPIDIENTILNKLPGTLRTAAHAKSA